MKKFIFKPLLLVVLAVTALTSMGENRIFIEDFEIEPGATKTVDLMMTNEFDVYQLQVFITPPEGLSVVPWKNSRIAEWRTERWYYYVGGDVDDDIQSHTFSFNNKDGQMRMVWVALPQGDTNYPFVGNSGSILKITFQATADFAGGDILIDNWKMQNRDNDIYATGGTEYDGDEIRVKVSVPGAPVTLASIVETGTETTEYTVADNLKVVTTLPNSVIVSDGQGNWMKVAATGDVYTALAAMDCIKGGTLTGTLTNANQNQVLTIDQAPVEASADQAVAVEIRDWTLAQSDPNDPMYKFAPKVNEVINLNGFWFDKDGGLRGYSNGTGQSATLNMAWCTTNTDMIEGAYYTLKNCVAQLKAPWDPETTSGAPARMKASDDLSFQNYEIYPTAINSEDVKTAVENLNSSKTVASVKYVNVAGQVSSTPFEGVNIVITSYADGSQTTSKVVK